MQLLREEAQCRVQAAYVPSVYAFIPAKNALNLRLGALNSTLIPDTHVLCDLNRLFHLLEPQFPHF